MSESKTSQRRLRAIERQRQALELRKAGVSFDEIGHTLGYAGPSGAYRAVMSALKRTLQEPADEVRKLELARLDRAQRVAWERMLQGDLEALARVIKVMEHRAKLLGLAAPVKIAPTNPAGDERYDAGFTLDEKIRRTAALLAAADEAAASAAGRAADAAVGGALPALGPETTVSEGHPEPTPE
jgi:hypothetical protein